MSLAEEAVPPATALRANCLNYWEVLAQSIAMLGPTATPVLIVPLMYASAGNASWLAYVFGMLLLLAVALSLRVFASREASSGSLYVYAERSFGKRIAALCGWCLLWAYGFVAIAGYTFFAIFASTLLAFAGVKAPAIVVVVACALVAWWFAYRDIRLSTITLLAIETASVTIISALILLVLVRRGAFDPSQLGLHGATLSAVSLGAVIAIFSFVGFESATALGEEAHEPLRTIPAAVIWSVVIAGIFFTLAAYAEIIGVRGASTTLDKLTTPLDTIADLSGVGYLKVPIDVFALLSSFSIALAAINGGARVAFAMARVGIFPGAAATVHEEHRTPHIAIGAFSLVALAVAVGMLAIGLSASDVFNDTATLGSFGFVAMYFFIAVGAPLYLRSRGELRPAYVALAIGTSLLLLVPAIGSVYPVPPPPTNYFPYLFAAYVVVGTIWLGTRDRRDVA